MRRRTSLVPVALGLLVVAGCSSSGDSAGSSPATTTAVDASAPVTEPAATDSSDSTDASASGTDSGTEAAAAPEKCSSDGAPTALDPLAGDLPQVAVDPAFEQSPLPNVTLRRINCDPSFVNFKNEAPTDKPVLYWFWAPF